MIAHQPARVPDRSCDTPRVRATVARWRRNSVVSTIVMIAVVIGLVFTVQALAVKPYAIPSGSMLPTLAIGQRVLVDRVDHHLGGTPAVGDVIVFHPPVGATSQTCPADDEGQGTMQPCATPAAERADDTFIKRVVGVAGDRIALRGGRVVRNDQLAREPFIAPCRSGDVCDFEQAITVPPNTVYVLGDNRGQSDDSRFWGPVRYDWVIGKAFGSYWPPKKVGGL